MSLGLSVEDLARVLALMGEHQVIELTFQGAVIRRSPPDGPRPPIVDHETELERLSRMSPDAQDRALMLRKTGGLG